jgi:hypothetical protein
MQLFSLPSFLPHVQADTSIQGNEVEGSLKARSVSACFWSRTLLHESSELIALCGLWNEYVCSSVYNVGKVKCTLAQALRLCTGRTAHRGSRGIALPFHDHCTRRGWGVSFTPRPLFTPGKDPVHIVQEAGCAPGPVWTGVGNFVSTGIRSPDHPARSQSLYRLSYPVHA